MINNIVQIIYRSNQFNNIHMAMMAVATDGAKESLDTINGRTYSIRKYSFKNGSIYQLLAYASAYPAVPAKFFLWGRAGCLLACKPDSLLLGARLPRLKTLIFNGLLRCLKRSISTSSADL